MYGKYDIKRFSSANDICRLGSLIIEWELGLQLVSI
jgi:hypothetical protein